MISIHFKILLRKIKQDYLPLETMAVRPLVILMKSKSHWIKFKYYSYTWNVIKIVIDISNSIIYEFLKLKYNWITILC